MQATSLNQFVQIFEHLKRTGQSLDRLDFHTHGGPGFISIGPDQIFYETLRSIFVHRGFEKIFSKSARIFFHGCNVAESVEGEIFLLLFGAIFLRERGGRVGASTSLGLAVPFTGKVIHVTGETVYAMVHPGGGVQLKNHSKLSYKYLKSQLTQIESYIPLDTLRKKHPKILDNINSAKAYLDQGGSHSSPALLIGAYEHLRDARVSIRRVLDLEMQQKKNDLFRKLRPG